jgi:hypothetical protein
VVEELSSEL